MTPFKTAEKMTATAITKRKLYQTNSAMQCNL